MRQDNRGAEPVRENRSGLLRPPQFQLSQRLNCKALQKQGGKSGQPNSKFFLSCTPECKRSKLQSRLFHYDAHLQWLHKEIVTIDGRKWADWSLGYGNEFLVFFRIITRASF